MKNVHGIENETSAPKKLIVEDLKKIIGGARTPHATWVETKEDIKVIIS